MKLNLNNSSGVHSSGTPVGLAAALEEIEAILSVISWETV